jgi:hypothetical protein
MRRNEGWVGGVVLIVIGVALLVGQVAGDLGRFVLMAIGLVLLVLYAVTRSPGTLIGGGIVTGLGVGVLAASYLTGDQAAAAVLLGLGGGFVLVWLIGSLRGHDETRIWPLIPGTILIVVAGGLLAQANARLVGIAWPVAIIAIGVAIIVAALLRREVAGPRPDQVAPPPPEHPGESG